MKIHLMVTVLLDCVDLFTTCMKIIIGTYHSVDIMFNALPSLIVNMCVSNACNMDFRLFKMN